MEESMSGEDKFLFIPTFTLMRTKLFLMATSLTQSTTSPPQDGPMTPTRSQKVGNAHVTWRSSLLESKTSTTSLNKSPNLLLSNKRRPIMTSTSLSQQTQNLFLWSKILIQASSKNRMTRTWTSTTRGTSRLHEDLNLMSLAMCNIIESI